jgi:hypothetical protein
MAVVVPLTAEPEATAADMNECVAVAATRHQNHQRTTSRLQATWRANWIAASY